MWGLQIVLAVIGLSAGITVAGGLFSFISGLGVISDFADRTHTGSIFYYMRMPPPLEGFWEIFLLFIR